MRHQFTVQSTVLFGLALATALQSSTALAQRFGSSQPSDPGVRRAATDNGTPASIPGLGADELNFFNDGMARFNFIEVVSGGSAPQGTGNGLGPRFNSNQCASCHSQPNVG